MTEDANRAELEPEPSSTTSEDKGPTATPVDASGDQVESTVDAPDDAASGCVTTSGQIVGAEPPADAEDDTGGEPKAAKKSPAEAFVELSESVHALRADVDEVGAFVRVCRDKLLRQADEYRLEGMYAVLDSLQRLHDITFRRVTTMEAGNAKPDAFIVNLFEMIEAELKSHGVQVIRPQPGEEVNLEVMTTIGTVNCPFWRKPDRVAQTNCCGFILTSGSEQRILRKAEITVFRR